MDYEKFIEEYLSKGLIKKQSPNVEAIKALLRRADKDIVTAKATLEIDEGISYTVAYLGMLRCARAFMLSKGFRPSDGYQHKTVVDFISVCFGDKYKTLVQYFDRMRRKRNIFTYESDICISKTEAQGAIEKACELIKLVKNLLLS